MRKCVQLMTTSGIVVCVVLDKILYAVKGDGYVRIVFGDNAAVNVSISIDELQNLIEGKSR